VELAVPERLAVPLVQGLEPRRGDREERRWVDTEPHGRVKGNCFAHLVVEHGKQFVAGGRAGARPFDALDDGGLDRRAAHGWQWYSSRSESHPLE
jgi:hypothetical protein